eukprot:jgi/Astpho2/2154/Aster-03147
MKAGIITSAFSTILRVSATLLLLTAAGLIAFGCIIQTPPKAPIPASCVFIGVMTILCSIFGFIGAHFRPGFLFVYIIMGSSVLTLQLMIVAVLWIEPQHVVDRIVAIDERDGIQDYSREGILAKLQVGKKVFLAVVILESLGLFIAGIMRWIGELDNPYRKDFADLEPGPEPTRSRNLPDQEAAARPSAGPAPPPKPAALAKAAAAPKPAPFSVTPQATRIQHHDIDKDTSWDRL